MANLSAQNAPGVPPSTSNLAQQLTSPRSTRTLRKLQSAHQLSSNYSASNAPSLISQQRQQQRNTSASNGNGIPQVPPIPIQHSPSKPVHHRTRSNSDAIPPSTSKIEPLSRRMAPPRRQINFQPPKDQLKAMISHGPKGDVEGSLRRLRHLILEEGLEADNDGMSQLRIYIWLILLNAPTLSTDTYLSLIHRGPSPAYAKIRNDTFRTLATDPLFKRRVSEASLIRLLNAIAWKLHDAKNAQFEANRLNHAATELGSPELQHASPVMKHTQQASITTATEGSEAGGSEPGIYVQGMNVLCAPFLYSARSEAEAFVAFHRFITVACPGYVRGAMDGVHRGVKLVDNCLAIVDPKLSAYLLSKGMKAEVYAFASVLTMCACTPPLPEVMQLWDFLFAYGPHLNILCICAQLMLMKERLMASPSPGNMLRNFPQLQAKRVIEGAVNCVRKIPNELYEQLVHHME